MRIRKDWSSWDPGMNFKTLPGAMGIYEIADEQKNCIYIGYAGGASPYGLRGELYALFGMPAGSEKWNWSHPHPEVIPAEVKQRAKYYRYEVTHNYYSRWIEDLTRFSEDYETLPELNKLATAPRPPHLGRYHWKSEGI